MQWLLGVAFFLFAGFMDPTQPTKLPMRTLAKGAFSGIQEPKQIVIKDLAQWEKIWARHSAGSKPARKIPEVDFRKEMVVLVTLGRQRTGGYAIEVAKAETVGDKLRITVRRTSPPAGAMTLQALTAPFHMVAIPRSDLAPEFVDEARDR